MKKFRILSIILLVFLIIQGLPIQGLAAPQSPLVNLNGTWSVTATNGFKSTLNISQDMNTNSRSFTANVSGVSIRGTVASSIDYTNAYEIVCGVSFSIGTDTKVYSATYTKAWGGAETITGSAVYGGQTYNYTVTGRFDGTNITQIIALNDSKGFVSGGKEYGHNAVLLVDRTGRGKYYSYYAQNYSPVTGGVMAYKDLNPYEVNNLLNKNGTIYYPINTKSEKLVSNGYDRFVRINISNTSLAKSAYDKAEEYRQNPGSYNLLSNNCTIIASNIMNAAGCQFSTESTPNVAYCLGLYNSGSIISGKYNDYWRLINGTKVTNYSSVISGTDWLTYGDLSKAWTGAPTVGGEKPGNGGVTVTYCKNLSKYLIVKNDKYWWMKSNGTWESCGYLNIWNSAPGYGEENIKPTTGITSIYFHDDHFLCIIRDNTYYWDYNLATGTWTNSYGSLASAWLSAPLVSGSMAPYDTGTSLSVTYCENIQKYIITNDYAYWIVSKTGAWESCGWINGLFADAPTERGPSPLYGVESVYYVNGNLGILCNGKYWTKKCTMP
ncbi:MAG TPA: hypothetical protein VF941_08545 [Clostridia bacterium]